MDAFTKSVTAAAGAATLLLSHHELGWFPKQYGNHQISVNGLGGGTYTVQVRVPGDSTFQTHQSGAAESDTVLVDRMIPDAFQVVFAGVPVENTPVVTVSTWPRRVG